MNSRDNVTTPLGNSFIIPNKSGDTPQFRLNPTQWDDCTLPIGGMVLEGTNDPTFGVFAGSVSTYLFAAGALNEIFFTLQVPHSYKEGTSIRPHVHWSPANTNTGNVLWKLEYKWVNIGTGNFASATDTIECLDAGSGTAGDHQVCGFPTIDGTGKTISSMMCGRLYRDGADAADTFTGNAALIEFDFHFEMNTIGSRIEFTK